MTTARPILFILGTRSEAIKALPVIRALEERHPDVPVRVGATGQHSLLFNQIAEIEGLRPAWNLEAMASHQVIHQLIGRILAGLERPIRQDHPALIVAVGDSASTLAAAIAAHLAQTPLAHIEAGIRGTHDNYPEEHFRRMITDIARFHFCPSQAAAGHLDDEGIANGIAVVGDSGRDALVKAIEEDADAINDPALESIDWSRHIALSTVVRRENHGDIGYRICNACIELARRMPNLQIIHVNHLNPHLASTFWGVLENKPGIRVIAPLPRKPFIHLLRRAAFVITDSGGVHEEATALGIPVVSLRSAQDCGRLVDDNWVLDLGWGDYEELPEYAAQALRRAQRTPRPASIQHPLPPAAPRIAERLAESWQECQRPRQ